MRAEMPIARAYAAPEGEIAEDNPACIQLTGDCSHIYQPEQLQLQIIDATKVQDEKIENSSTPTPSQEMEMAGGTGGEPLTNGPNNLFDDIATPIGITNVIPNKASPIHQE